MSMILLSRDTEINKIPLRLQRGINDTAPDQLDYSVSYSHHTSDHYIEHLYNGIPSQSLYFNIMEVHDWAVINSNTDKFSENKYLKLHLTESRPLLQR